MTTPPRDIDSILDDVVTLPSLPTTVARIVELVNDPQCSLLDVGKVVATDPAIALKTLRLANSAYYGLRQKVTSVEQAVVLLGLKVIKNMVFTATVFETLRTEMGAFLQHSVATGMAMRVLAESSRAATLSSPDEAFVYGLLHDVGKIVFEQFFPTEFKLVAKAVQEDGAQWYEAERAVLGVDHAQMGARLAQNWKLPEDLVHAIGGHHDLAATDARHHQVAALLSVADFLACRCGLGAHSPKQTVTVSEAHWAASGITAQMVPPLMERYFEAIPHVGELVAIAAVS